MYRAGLKTYNIWLPQKRLAGIIISVPDNILHMKMLGRKDGKFYK